MSEVEVSESGGGDVTFVGGKAVEQTTGGDSPDGAHGDELAAAKAAVKKVLEESLKEEGKTAAKEAKSAREKDPMVPRDRGPDGKFVPNEAEREAEEAKRPAKVAKEEEDADASALRKALAERREQARYKAEARAELEKSQQEARQVYQRLQRDRAELEAEKAKMALFRKDPIRAIRENGWTNPEEFILDIAQDGTPEGQARRQQRELQQKLAEMEQWRADQARQERERQENIQINQQRAFRQQVEKEFLREALSDKHEHISGLYKGNEASLIAQADTVAAQYRQATGKEATFAEIAEYLEERTARWYKQKSQARSVPDAGEQGSPDLRGTPTQGKATGKKSLSPSGSSE